MNLTWGFHPTIHQLELNDYVHITGWASITGKKTNDLPYCACQILNTSPLNLKQIPIYTDNNILKLVSAFSESFYYTQLKSSYFQCAPRMLLSANLFPNPNDLTSFLHYDLYCAFKIINSIECRLAVFALYPHGAFDLCLYFALRYSNLDVYVFRDAIHMPLSNLYLNPFDELDRHAWNSKPINDQINTKHTLSRSSSISKLESALISRYTKIQNFWSVFPSKLSFSGKIIHTFSVTSRFFHRVLLNNVYKSSFNTLFFRRLLGKLRLRKLKIKAEKVSSLHQIPKHNAQQVVDSFIANFVAAHKRNFVTYDPRLLILKCIPGVVSRVLGFSAKQEINSKHNIQALINTRKYCILFLHLQPEASTFIEGDLCQDQLLFISYVRNILPDDISLLIKPPPALNSDASYRYHTSFSKYVLNYPNTLYIDFDINSLELIQKSVCVATVSGSAGYEAIYSMKPVLFSGSPLWKSSPFAFPIKELINNNHLLRSFFSVLHEKKEFNDWSQNLFDIPPINFSSVSVPNLNILKELLNEIKSLKN